MHPFSFLTRFFCLGLLCAVVLPLRGQVLDNPITVPVGITATYLPQVGPGEYATLYATIGTATSLSHSAWGTLSWQSVDRVDFDLKPGKEYFLTTSQSNVSRVKWAFMVPSGYRLFVDDVDRLLEHNTTGANRIYRLRVVPSGSEARGLFGEAGSLRPVRVLWHVSMGYLRNAQGAGAIELREPTVAAAASVASLYYEFPSAEVDVRLAAGGVLRQVLAPDGLADIQNLGSSYEIRLYRPQQVGALSNGVYLLSGSPFMTYRVERPGTDVLRITLTRGARSEFTELSKTSATTWTVTDWTRSGSASQRLIDYAYSTDGNIEDITVKSPAPPSSTFVTASVTRKQYAVIGGGRELVSTTLGYGSANLTTTYEYYNTPLSPGSHRRLASITQPSGNCGISPRRAWWQSPRP
jgi:hypothetical protein